MTRARKHIHITLLQAVIALLSPSFLLSSCSSSDDGFSEPNPQDEKQEIRMNPDVWNFMEGTRAAFYTTGTPITSSFTAAAYVENSTTEYISPTTVNWETDKWVWSDGKHYWPASDNLDFFAYMPATAPTYITSGPSYTTARNPQFTCGSLPMTNAGQDDLQEFVYALVTGQNKTDQGNTGVTLTFQHPFTKIKMQLKEGHPAITINKITFKSIKNNGSYNHSGGWTPTGDATNLVLTLDRAFAYNVAAQEIGTYLMIPQAWAGAIEVEATWDDWGVSLKHTLTTNVPSVTWQPGYSYTYTFTISETDLIVSSSKFTEQW